MIPCGAVLGCLECYFTSSSPWIWVWRGSDGAHWRAVGSSSSCSGAEKELQRSLSSQARSLRVCTSHPRVRTRDWAAVSGDGHPSTSLFLPAVVDFWDSARWSGSTRSHFFVQPAVILRKKDSSRICT